MIELVVSADRVRPSVAVVGESIRITMNLYDDFDAILRENQSEILAAFEHLAWRLFRDSDVERDFETNASEFIVRFSNRVE
ncbi:MAG: hypothetical protein ABI570_06090 [Ilumatobacteraceae bacterium]